MAQLPDRIQQAYERIRPHVLKTPLIRSANLSSAGTDVYFKMESEQLTGSFKLRGACNKLLSMRDQAPELLEKGVTTASTGNHALGCLEASRICGCSLEIFHRDGISDSKKEALLKRGANLTTYGVDCVDAEIQARRVAKEQGKIYVSPYNDWDVAAGQGTVGLEIYDQLPDVDSVIVSVGGGGLIGGIASYLKSRNPKIQIVGCSPVNSKVMYESVKAGEIKHEPSLDTLSEGTVGDLEDDTITFPLCRDLVDRWILVEETDIEDALYHMVDKEHKIVEGSAAMVVAAYLSKAEQFRGQRALLLMCGANMNTADRRRVLNKYAVKTQKTEIKIIVEGSAAMVVAAYLSQAEQFRGQRVVLLMCGANMNTADLRRVLNKHAVS